MRKGTMWSFLLLSLATGLIPAGQCLTLMTGARSCCMSQPRMEAACSCCANKKHAPVDHFERKPCCSTTSETVQTPPAFNPRNIADILFIDAPPPIPATCAAAPIETAFFTRAGINQRQRPPDLPIFVELHTLLV